MWKRGDGWWKIPRRRVTTTESGPPDAGELQEVEATRPCPYCRARVSRGATVCLYCERDIVAVMSPGAFAEFIELRTNATETHEATETEQ